MPSRSGAPPSAPALPGAIPAAVDRFIAESRVGRLATADAAGQPMAVPICYAWDGGALYSALDAKPKSRPVDSLKRVRNIRENNRVAVVIDEYAEDWDALRYAIIQGRAHLLTGGDEFARAIDLLCAKYPQYRAMGLARDAGLMIKVEPTRIAHWASSPKRHGD